MSKSKFLLMTLVFLGSVLWPENVLATSLWPADGKSLYGDKKAMNVGDIVTIVVLESTTASQQVSVSRDESGSIEAQLLQVLQQISTILGGGLPRVGDVSVGAGSNRESGGQVDQRGQLKGQITATIIDKEPNGNLVIEGHKTLSINGENQILTIRGRARPSDISPDNTIPSSLLADAEITFNGKGPISEKENPGIITRLLNWLF